MTDPLPTPGPLHDLTAFHRLAAARLGGFEHTTVPDEPGLRRAGVVLCAVEHGGVDSVIRFSQTVPPHSVVPVVHWVAAGNSWAEAESIHQSYLSGDIAEVRVFSAALSDTDRLGHERAMRCAYGLSGGATPAAPTGLTGTAGNRRISLNWLMSPGVTSYNVWRSTNGGMSFDLVATDLPETSYVDTAAATAWGCGQIRLPTRRGRPAGGATGCARPRRRSPGPPPRWMRRPSRWRSSRIRR